MPKPKITNRRSVTKSRLFEVEAIDLTFSNGEERCYERLKTNNRGAVVVVPIIDDNHFFLIKEYAVGMEDYELCFPKGALDEGEAICDAANRELQEEIGYGAEDLYHIRSMHTSPGYLTSQMHVVVARHLYEAELAGDEPEPLEVIKWRKDQIDQLLLHPRFCGAVSLAALSIAFGDWN